MQTFKEIDRTETNITYEYRAIFGYWLYGTVFAWIFVISGDYSRVVELAFAGLIFVYLFVVFIPSRSRAKQIREAMKSGGIQMVGSRWSFSNPLRIVIPINAQEAAANNDA